MKAKVQRWYINGKRLVPHALAPGLDGELCLVETRNENASRLTMEAWLVKKGGIPVVPTLSDARVISIGANGMMIRGIETGDDGQEVRQEWWCEIILDK